MSHVLLSKCTSLSSILSSTLRSLSACGGPTTSRGSALSLQASSLRRTIADMEEAVTTCAFSAVFMHRYRDSNPAIRALCLEHLGGWMAERPGIFLEDKYLKYFAWMLHDGSAEVRRAALGGLRKPFEAVDAGGGEGAAGGIDVEKMKNVCVKFLPHLADLTVDVDGGVQLGAMRLLLSLLREGFLDEFEDEGKWDLINFRR